MTELIKSNHNFRQDINGLRAWAILVVVLYHFGVAGFQGGFQGVDIFFVISGYLMTKIIVTGLENHAANYSIREFYLSRAIRIIPALLFVSTVLLILGWWMLPSLDYQLLAKDSLLSNLFLSNYRYWRLAGYFDSHSHFKWMLHTWSLSVEWQFYLLYPIFISSIWRISQSRTVLKRILYLFALISLSTSIWQSQNSPNTAFFLLPSRVWELLAGGLVYLQNSTNNRIFNLSHRKNACAIAGLALLTTGLILYSPSDLWPSWHAVFSVSGAALIILANHQSRLTHARWSQWMGERSYSIYLWHWPFAVVLYNLGQQSSPWAIGMGIAGSLIAGSLSHAYIEKPSRHLLKSQTPKKAWSILLTAVLLHVALCSYIYAKSGIHGRLPPTVESLINERSNINLRAQECQSSSGDSSPGCVYGGSSIKLIVIGDSHATSVLTGVAAALPDASSGLRAFSYVGCPVLLNATMVPGKFDSNHQCFSFIKNTLNQINQEHPNAPLLIVNRWAEYAIGRNEQAHDRNVPYVYFDKIETHATPAFIQQFQENLTKTLCTLAQTRKVYVLNPIPEMVQDVPSTLARKARWGSELDVTISRADYIQRQQFVLDALNSAHEQCGVNVIDTTSMLCSDDMCHGAKDGHALYYDDDHLNEYGNKLLTPLFKEIFEK